MNEASAPPCIEVSKGIIARLRTASERPCQCEPFRMHGPARGIPVEHRARARVGRQRVGNVIAVMRVSFGEFLLAPVAYGVRQVAFEIAEKRERFGRPPFFAHEQQRRRLAEAAEQQGLPLKVQPRTASSVVLRAACFRSGRDFE